MKSTQRMLRALVKQVYVGIVVLLTLGIGPLSHAQEMVTTNSDVVVPPLVSFSGALTDVNGKALAELTAVTFYLYKDQQGGAPLWMETQNVTTNNAGRYTVLLGSTSSQGLPADLFSSGEARWLGVQPRGQEEQPRVMLLSVPYALKAGDAQTLGGLPPSAFVLATPPSSSAATTEATTATAAARDSPATSSEVTTTGGTVDAIPLFSTATNIQNSLLTQTGTTAINIGGKLNLPALGTATTSGGFNSRPQDFVASVFSGSTAAAVPQTFQWQAEPEGNDTTTASGSLHLLYGSGTTTPAETGLHIASNGLITFASGQTLPSVTGNETVSGELTVSQLISTVATGTAPLTVTSSTQVANLNASLLGGKAASAFATLTGANTFTGNQTVNGNLSATGVISSNGYQIGSNLFDYGSYSNGNAFLGFAGNTSATGVSNTGVGFQALNAISSGFSNTGVGSQALYLDNSGSYNTAVGWEALFVNSTACCSTATGFEALQNNNASANAAFGYQALTANTSGTENAALGSQALVSNTTGTGNTASGYQALVNNTGGSGNTALGSQALYNNTCKGTLCGNSNTAIGTDALAQNTTGTFNIGLGITAGFTFDSSPVTGRDNILIGNGAALSTGSLSYATAIGNFAEVSESNALVLGSIQGFNSAPFGTNVGIGTTAPQAALDVAGYNLETFIGNPGCGANPFAGIAFGSSGFQSCGNYSMVGDGSDTYIAAPTGNIYFRTNNNQETNMVIYPGPSSLGGKVVFEGFVGVGTTDTPNLLTLVQGGGPALADGWNTYSSRRWKTNIHPLTNALGKVERMRGVSYDLKDSGKHEIGVIAEEVGEVVPEVVSYEKNGKDATGVDYSRLTALLIEAVKQQQTEIAAQQKQLATQQTQIRKQQYLTNTQQLEISKQQRFLTTQRQAIARLSRKVGVLESSLRSSHGETVSVLESR